jgi:hypothetical protein
MHKLSRKVEVVGAFSVTVALEKYYFVGMTHVPYL